MVELIPTLSKKDIRSTDWLSKDITVHLAKFLLGDALNNIWNGLLQSLDCDGKWKLCLSTLRHHLWPEVPCDGKRPNYDTNLADKLHTTLDESHQAEPQKDTFKG